MSSMSSSPVIIFFLLLLSNGIAAKLSSPEFYSLSCPQALTTIRLAVNLAVLNESRIGASLLRLHFHDCFVNGCDASILLDDTPSLKGEKKAFSNINSMRGYEIIDLIKSQLEHLCPSVVSCADILAVAARDSVVALGGPSWSVQLGRRDSTTASLVAANRDLPDHSSNLTTLISSFSSKGFTAQEMVALSGAHTIGKARCKSFRNRVYNEKNINSAFAYWVRANCPLNSGDKNLSPFDGSTSTFDNTYFKYLKNSMGLLHTDQQLYNRGPTDYLVHTYSINTTVFFLDFANAMIKMGSLAPITESTAEIRTSCRKTNWPNSYDY